MKKLALVVIFLAVINLFFVTGVRAAQEVAVAEQEDAALAQEEDQEEDVATLEAIAQSAGPASPEVLKGNWAWVGKGNSWMPDAKTPAFSEKVFISIFSDLAIIPIGSSLTLSLLGGAVFSDKGMAEGAKLDDMTVSLYQTEGKHVISILGSKYFAEGDICWYRLKGFYIPAATSKKKDRIVGQMEKGCGSWYEGMAFIPDEPSIAVGTLTKF